MKTKLIYLFLFVSSILTVVGSFFADPDHRWILWCLLGLLVIALISAGVYSYISYKKKVNNQLTDREILLKQDKAAIKQLIQLAKKSLGRNFTEYKVPLYIMVGAEFDESSLILSYNGFESVLDESVSIKVAEDVIISESDSFVKFWHSDNAVVIQLGHMLFDENGFNPDLWNYFTSELYSIRNQQACTGFIYALGCDFIQTGDSDYHDKVMINVRNGILDFCKTVRIQVPVFLALTNADAIKDFVPFFSIFDEVDTAKPLGFSVKNGQRYSFDFANYDLKTREMVEFFSQNSDKFIKNLSENDSRSILSFPYQLALFFGLLRDNLACFTKENRTKRAVWVRGIYFLVPNQKDVKYDLLAQYVSDKADFKTDARTVHNSFDRKRYFVERFFENAIIAASCITGVNQQRRMMRISSYAIKFGLTSLLLIYGIHFYYQNWNEYVKSRNSVVETIKYYNEDLYKLNMNSNSSLADVTIALDELRLENERIHQTIPFYKIVSIEQIAMPFEFQQFYEGELKNILFRKLEMILRENLYTLENLNDTNNIYKGYSAYMMLFDKSIMDEQFFNDYLDDVVIPENNFNTNLYQALSALRKDLFKTDYDKIELNQDLELVDTFEHHIDSVSVEDMLYSLVKLKHKNSALVDLTSSFGPNFKSLFYFKDGYTGYKIPFMFTAEGFKSIDLSPRSEEIRDMLKNLKLVKSNIDLSNENIKDIVYSVQRKYFEEYVDVWNDLIDNIQVKSYSDLENMTTAIDLITNPKNGALEMFMNTIITNTKLNRKLKTDSDSENDKSNKEQDENSKAAASNHDYLDGGFIASEFNDFFIFAGTDDENNFSKDPTTPFVELNQRLINLETTLKAFNKNSSSADRLIFEHIVKNIVDGTDEISLYDLVNESTPNVLMDTISSIDGWINSVLLTRADKYIRTNWNTTVYSYYQKELQGKFPFDLSSESEVNIVKLDKFLAHNGILDTFYKKFLSPFVEISADGYYTPTIRNGFDFTIPDSLLDKLRIVDEIQKTLYAANPDSSSFKLRITPRKMSGKARMFEYSDGSNYCSYNQGPRQPCEVSWPNNSMDKVNLSFTGSNNYPYGYSLSSTWGIVKAMMDPTHSVLSSTLNNNVQQWTFSNENYQIIYDIQIVGSEGNILPIYLFPSITFSAW